MTHTGSRILPITTRKQPRSKQHNEQYTCARYVLDLAVFWEHMYVQGRLLHPTYVHLEQIPRAPANICLPLQCAVLPDPTLIEEQGQHYMHVLLHMWCMHSMNCEWCQNTVSVHVGTDTLGTQGTQHQHMCPNSTQRPHSQLYGTIDYPLLQESVTAEKQQWVQDECYECHQQHQERRRTSAKRSRPVYHVWTVICEQILTELPVKSCNVHSAGHDLLI